MKQLVFSFSVILLSFNAKAQLSSSTNSIAISAGATADTICAGTTVTFKAHTANGCVPAFQWLLNGVHIPGATADTFSTGGLSTGDTISVETAASIDCDLPATAVSNGIGFHVISAPAAPGVITGNINPCAGTGEIYSIAPVAEATSYIWTMPSGWTGSGSDTGIVANVGSAGVITVAAVNACGSGLQSALHVHADTIPAAPTAIVGSPIVCAGSSEIYSAHGSGASSYIWTLPAGWSGHSAGNSVNAAAGSAGGIITVAATGACGTSAAVSLPVIVLAPVTPAVSIATPHTAVCVGALTTFVASSTYGGGAPSYQWMLNGKLLSAAGPSYTTDSLKTGDVVKAILISDEQCLTSNKVSSNQVVMNVLPTVVPGVTISANRAMPLTSGMPVTFTASYTGGGSKPAFQWLKNGLPIPFATKYTYTTTDLKHGDTISVLMTTSAACPAFEEVASGGIGIRTTTTTGINDAAGAGTISLYPNPSNGRFTVVADLGSAHAGQTVQVELLNMMGQSVYSATLKLQGAQLNVDVQTGAQVANGMYQLKLRTQDMQVTKPVVIQR